MSYKSILVHVDQTAQSRERIRLAAAIAEDEQAQLIGTAMTGISHFVFRKVHSISTTPLLIII